MSKGNKYTPKKSRSKKSKLPVILAIVAVLAVIAVILIVLLTRGGSGDGTKDAAGVDIVSEGGSTIPQVFSADEYNLYQNIFYNQTGGDYVGSEITKTGVFTKIHDSYNGRERYYVWGYYDQTKCCDWQWEFVPKNPASLPVPGSLVSMTGTFAQSADALDGYWFENATLTVTNEFHEVADIPMTTMSATLERVQYLNMKAFNADFNGKTVSMYGRVFSLNQIQHPYYDDVWTQEFAGAASVPPIGNEVILTGKFNEGVVCAAEVVATNDY